MKEGGALQFFNNHVHDSFNILQHIMIPKSQNSETLISEPSITVSIVIRVFSMLSPINFNNQSLFQAHKIDNVSP